MDNFDIIYFINLNHRLDRLHHIMGELKKTNINFNLVHRIEACYIKNFGALGCSMSHAYALEHFTNTDDSIKNCLILEDDFEFTQTQENVNMMLNNFFKSKIEYDVLLLSSNVLKEESTEYNFITKVYDAQTTSSYCVNKKFAPILLDNFKQSIIMLEKTKSSEYCCDIYWKKLQPFYNWFCMKPKIGKQMQSYSDIENQLTNYNC